MYVIEYKIRIHRRKTIPNQQNGISKMNWKYFGIGSGISTWDVDSSFFLFICQWINWLGV